MNANHKPPSPDIYPGLDDELEAVYRRNVAEGRAKPTTEGHGELEVVVEEELKSPFARPEIGREEAAAIYQWADPQLKEALDSWRKYSPMSNLIPGSTEELGARNPNFPHTMKRLYEARQALMKSNEETPEGLKVGETMHLVLIPWEEIKNNLSNFGEWVKKHRETQALELGADYINPSLLDAIQQDMKLYRDPQNPENLLTSSEYLDKKIAQDGPWGVMLVQTSNDAGTNGTKGKSPDSLTAGGQEHLQVAGHNVDAMGIFEWLALTLQQDPTKLSREDVSWLLANRLDVYGDFRVSYGHCSVDQVMSDLHFTIALSDFWQPRLAVM
ncbi:MAG: hypothetical protein Q7R60_02705 [bacterium]|nr:hypothetical protein [bacterium]